MNIVEFSLLTGFLAILDKYKKGGRLPKVNSFRGPIKFKLQFSEFELWKRVGLNMGGIYNKKSGLMIH